MIYLPIPTRWLITSLLDITNKIRTVEVVNAGWNDWLSKTARKE